MSDNDVNPVIYEDTSLGSTSSSTEANQRNGRKHFQFFWKSKHPNSNKEFYDLTESEICDTVIHGEFGGYLANNARLFDDDKFLAKSTALSMFSGVKMYAFGRFPRNDIFKEEFKLRWATITSQIDKNIGKRNIEDQVQISKSSIPVGRVLLAECFMALILTGKAKSA